MARQVKQWIKLQVERATSTKDSKTCDCCGRCISEPKACNVYPANASEAYNLAIVISARQICTKYVLCKGCTDLVMRAFDERQFDGQKENNRQ